MADINVATKLKTPPRNGDYLDITNYVPPGANFSFDVDAAKADGTSAVTVSRTFSNTDFGGVTS